jgi:predicted phosphohydrolase
MRPYNLLKVFSLLLISVIAWRRAFDLYAKAHFGFRTLKRNKDSPLLDPLTRNHHTEVLGTSNEKMFHFMQITDIHVSRYYKVGGLPHLRAFIHHELPLIAPDILLNTVFIVLCQGDLTDAKTENTLNSLQHESEWQDYHKLLEKSRILERNGKRFYWDQRGKIIFEKGNHDCWNVPSFQSLENMFTRLSAVKEEGYAFQLEKAYGTYSFVAIDGCPETGAGRPLNFFASLDTNDMDFLASNLLKSIKEKHNHTFAMSHYPIATSYYGRTSDGVGFSDMTHHVSIWLSGHLHKLAGGFGETMYAVVDGKVLELELGDMKSHGMYRIIVVDHDLVSFLDLNLADELKLPLSIHHRVNKEKFTRPPIVIVTNPKDGRFMIPGKEPFKLIRMSTHIRVLVWCDAEIDRLKIMIDNVELDAIAEYNGRGKPWNSIQNIDEFEPYIPLWTIPWDPKIYDDDQIHILNAIATDKYGRSGNHTVRFRVDGERIKKMDASYGGFIISLPLGLLFKDLFIISYVTITCFFLLVPKLFVLCIEIFDLYGAWRKETSYTLIELDKESQLYHNLLRPSIRTRIRHRWYDFKFTIVIVI